jgi:hypothetical protein
LGQTGAGVGTDCEGNGNRTSKWPPAIRSRTDGTLKVGVTGLLQTKALPATATATATATAPGEDVRLRALKGSMLAT